MSDLWLRTIDWLFIKLLMSYSWRGSQSESLHSSSFQLEDSSQSINMMEEALPSSTAGWRCQRLPMERRAQTQIDSLLSGHGLSVQQFSALVWWSQPFSHQMGTVERVYNGRTLVCGSPLKASVPSDMIERAQRNPQQLLSLPHFSAGYPVPCWYTGFYYWSR